VSRLLLYISHVPLLMVESLKEREPQRARTQFGDAGLLADSGDLAIEAHIAKRCPPLAQQERFSWVCSFPMEPDIAREGLVGPIWDLNRAYDVALQIPDGYARFAAMCWCVGESQGADFSCSQAPICQQEDEQLIHHRPHAPNTPCPVGAIRDIGQQERQLCLGQ